MRSTTNGPKPSDGLVLAHQAQLEVVPFHQLQGGQALGHDLTEGVGQTTTISSVMVLPTLGIEVGLCDVHGVVCHGLRGHRLDHGQSHCGWMGRGGKWALAATGPCVMRAWASIMELELLSDLIDLGHYMMKPCPDTVVDLRVHGKTGGRHASNGQDLQESGNGLHDLAHQDHQLVGHDG